VRAGIRRGSLRGGSPDALAAGLPSELRSTDGLVTASDYKQRAAAIAAWLAKKLPGQGWETLPPMPADATVSQLRQRLNETTARQRQAPLPAALEAAGVAAPLELFIRHRLAASANESKEK